MPGPDHQKAQTTCLLVLTFIAAGAALYFVREAVIPLVLAMFFVILLKPLIDWQIRHLRLPSGVALATTLLLAGVLLFGFVGVTITSVSALTTRGDEYAERVSQLEDQLSGLLERFGIDGEDRLERVLESAPELAREVMGTALAGLVDVVSQAVLVLIFMGFLLTGMIAPATGLWESVSSGVQRYLNVKIGVSVLTALLVYCVLWLCNVPLAPLWALITFVLNFIPNIGSIIANLLPIPIILLDPDVKAPWVAVLLPIGMQFVVGNVVEPKLMGKSLDLHPVTVLVALIFWGILWGFVGMLLSVPLTMTLRILMEASPHTRPLAEAMAGRFPRRGPAPGA